MPNWCYTDYKIEGEKDTLDKIYKAIENPSIKEGSSKDWEGNVLSTLGIDFKNCFIRGFIEDSDLEYDVLSIYTTEAWYRTDFARLLEDKFPDINIYWKAEEPGMAIYETNDSEGKYFTERYYIEIYKDNDYITEYFDDKEDAYNWIKEITGYKTDEEIESNEDIFIHEFEIV